MDNKNSAGGGLGLGTILTIIFVILKLCKVITWSWWWVFAPLWISALIVILVLIIVFIVAAITARRD